jgi:hypothetical protein
MSNYWLKLDRLERNFFVFQTVFGQHDYDLPADCDLIKSVTEVNGVLTQNVNWFQQSRRKITLIPTPTTSSQVVVEFLTK